MSRPALLPLILVTALLAACTATPTLSPAPPPDPAEDVASRIDQAVAAGSPPMRRLRALLVTVDGVSKLTYYREGFGPTDHNHIWSVTKSVLSLVVGIAIEDGLLEDVDQTLGELLPERRRVMTPATAKVTLRQVMTMSAGFESDVQGPLLWDELAEPGRSHVDFLLERRQPVEPGRNFVYANNASSQIAVAVLAAALARRGDDRPLAVLRYTRAKLFEPLGIVSTPAFTDPLPDPFVVDFGRAGFGWATNPNGLELGGLGMRLTAPDLLAIGELARLGGRRQGRQVVPAAWIEESTRPSSANEQYGLSWWLPVDPEEDGYNAAGYGGQRIFVLPEKKAVVVYVFSTLSGDPPAADLERLDEIALDVIDG